MDTLNDYFQTIPRLSSDRSDPLARDVTNLDDGWTEMQKVDNLWTLQVATVEWRGSHTPYLKWHNYQTWESEPTPEHHSAAKAKALTDPRYFRTCKKCSNLQNIGHMHDKTTCQGCSGVIY